MAINRANLGPACQSDPAVDLPTTIGGEDGLEWTWACGGWTYLGINMLHDEQRLRLQVGMPPGSEGEAQPLLDQLAQNLTFADTAGVVATGPDRAAIDAALQGTFETAWHPVELEAATIEAAGLPPIMKFTGTPGSVRWAIKFQNRLLTVYEGDDAGPYEIGWQGT